MNVFIGRYKWGAQQQGKGPDAGKQPTCNKHADEQNRVIGLEIEVRAGGNLVGDWCNVKLFAEVSFRDFFRLILPFGATVGIGFNA